MSKESRTPLETSVVKAIQAKLRAVPGCRVKKFHGTMYGAVELDLYGVYRGMPVFIEVKRPGGKPTLRQESEIAAWRAVGACTGVVHSVVEAIDLIEAGHREWRARWIEDFA